MRHKIEMKYFYGWDDAGWTEEKDGEIKPLRFQTFSHAQAALNEFFAEVKTAVVAGNMNAEEVSTDYRIAAEN